MHQYFLIFLSIISCSAKWNDSLPLEVPAVTATPVNGTCPSAAMREATHQSIQEQVESLLAPSQPPCPCGGPGQWTRIAYLNMSDISQQCPSNWNLVTTPVRGCSRLSAGGSCDSANFPSNGRSYSRVCGRLNAYMKGSPSAFEPSIVGNPGLEGVYLEGVSLTHGTAGSRQHIWSFANALFETDLNYNSYTRHVCSCTNTNFNWPHQVPTFVGNNYFCATANPGPGYFEIIYADDPLWDGEGCGSTSTCCEFNNPPWFCTTLPQPTTDDIEVRICQDQGPDDEDDIISLIDIYVV